jgi:hypothetical protein
MGFMGRDSRLLQTPSSADGEERCQQRSLLFGIVGFKWIEVNRDHGAREELEKSCQVFSARVHGEIRRL